MLIFFFCGVPPCSSTIADERKGAGVALVGMEQGERRSRGEVGRPPMGSARGAMGAAAAAATLGWGGKIGRAHV